MVADVELAISMIQLTGTLLPVMAAITRYYFQNRNRWAFETTDDDLEVLFLLILLYSLVIWAYAFSALVVITETGPFLSLAVISYGLFLIVVLLYTLGWITFFLLLLTGGFVILTYWALTGTVPFVLTYWALTGTVPFVLTYWALTETLL